MIVFKDKISGDEMLTDSFKFKLVDDCYYEVPAKMKTEKNELSDSLFGGNASAEGGAEEADDGAVTGIDVVMANRLQEITESFNKKSFKKYIQDYSKEILRRLEEEAPERVEPFKAGMAKLIKRIFASYKDWQMFAGESANPDGMVAFLNWTEGDDSQPYMIFIKDGMDEEKM